MKYEILKNTICGLIISATLIGMAIPKESGMLDVVLFVTLMTAFLYMVLPTQKS